MGGGQGGEHASPREVREVEHGQDEQVAEATAQQVPGGEIGLTEEDRVGVDGELWERRGPGQEDAADEQATPSGQVGDRIGELGEEATCDDDDDGAEGEENKDTGHSFHLGRFSVVLQHP